MWLVVRGMFVALMTALSVVLAHAPAHALTDLGQVCFSLTELQGAPVDTLRVGLTLHDGPAPLVSAVFRWRNTSPSFHVLGTGSLTQSVSGGSFDLALLGTVNTPAAFNGHRICAIYGVLVPPTFNGSWQLSCTGGPSVPFTANGTVTIVSCTSAMDGQ